jgi:sugar-phosphatase
MFGNKKFAAFLFDMDGTVLNSIPVVERVWGNWARRHGLDVEALLPTVHGIRAIDTIARLGLPGVDAAREAVQLLDDEVADVEGIHAIPGVLDFLASLPPKRWAIVTSAPRDLALKRMAVAGIPLPDIIVTGEDVSAGKPAPDCYLLGAQRLGVDARDCLVFEDAPAGIQAGRAAGADVVVITATHQHPVETEHLMIASYDGIRTVADDHGLTLLAAETTAVAC